MRRRLLFVGSPMSQKEVLNTPALTPELREAVDEWRSLTEWLDKGKARELELRNKLCAVVSKEQLTEGVNTVRTADGWEFKIDHKVNRKLDETALDAVMCELPEDSPYRQLGVLITYKPALVLGGFRTMPEDQKMIFAQALTETDGTPSLDVRLCTPETQPDQAPAVPATVAGVAPGADPQPELPGIPPAPAVPAKAKRTANGKAKKGARSTK